jgi:hypothetical protein
MTGSPAIRGSLEFGFTVTSLEAEWLVDEKPDVDFDEWHSGYAQGTAGERLVTVTLGADFDAETGELSGLERSSSPTAIRAAGP